MKSLFLTVFSLSMAALVPPALAQPAGDTVHHPAENAPRHDAADHQFLTRAYDDNRREVDLGKLAKDKGENQLVRDLGQQMIDDHTLAQNELERIASDRGLALPAQSEPAKDDTYNHLSQLSGQAFDDAYIQHMQKDHADAIRQFQSEANRGTDRELKHYAERQIPMLRAHEEVARLVQRQEHAAGQKPPGQKLLIQPSPSQPPPSPVQPNPPQIPQPGTAPGQQP